MLLRAVEVQQSCCGTESLSQGQVEKGHSQLFPGVLALRCCAGWRAMCQTVQDASIHPSQGGLGDKTTLQGQPGSGGAPNRLLCSGTLRSGLGVGSRSSCPELPPELPWAWRVLVLPLLLCQLLPNPTGALQDPLVGSLPPPHPLSFLNSLVQNCSGSGRRLDLALTVLEALAVLKASKTKTFLRLHLEQEKVFPLGFYSSRKAGFYFCFLRQKILLGADSLWWCREGRAEHLLFLPLSWGVSGC